MDWEVQTIQLREGANGEAIDPIAVSAHVSGVLGIHRLPELGEEEADAMRGWTITHVATGRKLIADELATECTKTRVQRLVGWIYSNISPNSAVWQVTIEDVEADSPTLKRLLRALQSLAHRLGWKPNSDPTEF